MIPRLILLLALVFAIYYLRQKILKAPVGQRKSLIWKYGLIGLAVVLIGLAAAGRVHWVSAMVAAALPFIRQAIPMLIRYFPALQHYYKTQQGQQGPAMGNQSSMETSILKMQMDHDSGQLSGEVLAGPFQGRPLDSMSQQELLSLLDYCQQQDMDSCKLLVSYLNHRFGDGWHEGMQPAANSDMDELEAHERREGMYGSIFWWVVKLGMAVAIAGGGLLLNATGFDVALEGNQSERAITLMRLFDAFMPVVASGIAIWAIATYSITEERAHEVRLDLEARRGSVWSG